MAVLLPILEEMETAETNNWKKKPKKPKQNPPPLALPLCARNVMHHVLKCNDILLFWTEFRLPTENQYHHIGHNF